MALSAAFEVLAQLGFSSWRSLIPAAVGVAAGLGIFYGSGQTPASAAVAFALGLMGIAIGVAWHLAHRHRRDRS